MMFQLPYLHLGGSMRLGNHPTFKLLKIDGGDLLNNHGELCRTTPKHCRSTRILIRVMVTTYIMMESKFVTLLGTTFLPKAFSFEEASYNGGGNITFIGTLGDGSEFTARLFKGELFMGHSQVHFTYSVKSSGNSQLGLALEFYSATNEKKLIFLAASGNTLLTLNQFSSRFTNVIMPHRVTKLEDKNGWVVQESTVNMPGHLLGEIRAVCYKSKPEKSVAVVADKTLSRGASDSYYAVLGDIKVVSNEQNSKFPPSNSWLVDSEYVGWTRSTQGSRKLSVKIVWGLKVDSDDIFAKYNVYVDKVTSSLSGNQTNEFLGVAFVRCFYVSDLEVPEGTSSVKFIIQVCGLDGACQKNEDCPFFQLQVEDS